jgi:hypothetical protein
MQKPLSSAILNKDSRRRWVYLALAIASLLVIAGVLLFAMMPRRGLDAGVIQVDAIASQSLSGFLADIGARGMGSVCWLGDPEGQALKIYLNHMPSRWRSWTESLKISNGIDEKNCFGPQVKAIVVRFPVASEVYRLPREQTAKVQGLVSDLLSQGENAADFQRLSSTFILSSGQLLIYGRKPLPN